jgi:hypothetical protein
MNPRDDDREDDLLARLKDLPPHDVDAATAARQRRRALAVFAPASTMARFGVRAEEAWSRVLLPLALAGIVAMYLSWAVDAANALYR